MDIEALVTIGAILLAVYFLARWVTSAALDGVVEGIYWFQVCWYFVFGVPVEEALERWSDQAQSDSVPVPAQSLQRSTLPVYAPHPPLSATQRPPTLADLPAPIRQHTLIAARPGDGKTATLNTLLVADIAAGHQVIVANPQFAYYHPTDQPIDLRPIRDQFEAVFDYAGIERTLSAVYGLVEGRNALYREGQDVGHAISVIIDEWPSIVSSDYGPACTALVQKLVREARKCNIWLTLAAQDGQVETLGFRGGVRASFLTRLCGNVDPATWRALCGAAVQRPVARGQWATEDGIVTVERPTAAMIAALAGQGGVGGFAMLSDREVREVTPVKRLLPIAERVAGAMVRYEQERGTLPAQRWVERELFGYNGGEAYDQVSKAWSDALLLRETWRSEGVVVG